MTNRSTTIKILNDSKAEILEEWVKAVKERVPRIYELINEEEHIAQSKALLDKIISKIGTQSSFKYHDFYSPVFDDLLSLMNEISIDRIQNDFMPTEIVSISDSLRIILQKHLSEHVEDSELLASETEYLRTFMDNFIIVMYESFLTSVDDIIGKEELSRFRFEEKLRGLHRHATLLNKAETVQDVVDYTYDAMVVTLGLSMCGFFTREGNYLREFRARGIPYALDDSTGKRTPITMPLDGNGIVVKAARTKRTIRLSDVRQESDYMHPKEIQDFGSEKIWLSELTVPVIADENVIAILNTESTRLNAFTQQDQELLETLASHVSSAIQRIRLLEEKEEYEERLKGLHRHASLLSTAESVQNVADYTTDAMHDILGFWLCMFMINEGDHLRMISYRGQIAREGAINLKLPLNGKGITVRAANLKKTMLIPDVRDDPDYLSRPMIFKETDKPIYETLSELSVLVIAEEQVLAILNTESINLNEYDLKDQELLETLASHVASAISRIIAKEAVREIAYRLNSLEPGGYYLSDSHERCLKAYAILTMQGVPGLCIVREDPLRLINNYGIKADEIVLLSSRPFKGFKALQDLQTVSLTISRFLESGKGVVLFDGLEYLITRFGFDAVYSFIQEKRFDFLESEAVLLVPLDMDTLEAREKALLSSEFSQLE